MGNPFTAVEHVAETVGENIVTGVEYPVEFLVKAERVITSAIKDQPQIKTSVIELIKQAQGVIGDVATAGSAKGLDLASDAKTLADAEAFFAYFKNTFVPLVEQGYSEVAADIK